MKNFKEEFEHRWLTLWSKVESMEKIVCHVIFFNHFQLIIYSPNCWQKQTMLHIHIHINNIDI